MNKDITKSLALAGAILLASAGLKAAEHYGFISGDMAERGVQVILGLMVAGYGNMMPKGLGPLTNPVAARRAQQALRIAGWAFVLAGLAYVGVALLVPEPYTHTAYMAVMLPAVAVGMGLVIWIAVSCMGRSTAR